MHINIILIITLKSFHLSIFLSFYLSKSPHLHISTSATKHLYNIYTNTQYIYIYIYIYKYIYVGTLACVRLRYADFTPQEKRALLQKLEFILTGTGAAARENDAQGIAGKSKSKSKSNLKRSISLYCWCLVSCGVVH